MTQLPPAKKSLGQCFLVERGYAQRTVDALGIEAGQTVLEIGPGRGILTQELLDRGARVLAIEIDQRLLESLRGSFGSNPGFSLLHQDILDTRFEQVVPPGGAKVAGNLPYHLVSEILFRLFKHAQVARLDSTLPWIDVAVLMMQKEVAERVAARPGSKTWGRISVFAQLEAHTNLMFTVPAAAFRPAPKVDGGVVRFDFQRIPEVYPKNFQTFERIVRFTFHQRRKMLKSSLSGLPGVHPFWQTAPLDFTRRPETLSPREWVELADFITSAQERRGNS